MNVLRNRWLWAYLAIYAILLFGLVRFEGLEPAEPLFILAILGIGFSLLALLFTRGLTPLAYEVRSPKAELIFLCVWLVVITGYSCSASRLLMRSPRRSRLTCSSAP